MRRKKGAIVLQPRGVIGCLVDISPQILYPIASVMVVPMGNKESQSGLWSGLVSKFLSRAALKLEEVTTAPLPDERISRREFFRRGKKKGEELGWVSLIAIGGTTFALSLWAKNEAESQIRLASDLTGDLKTIPSGERLVFLKPGRSLQLSKSSGRISLSNGTRNLSLGMNTQALETPMKEEHIDLAGLGSIDFFVISNLPAATISLGNRKVTVNIHESNDPLAEKDFLGKESLDLSSSIGAVLFLGRDAKFWQSKDTQQLFRGEQQRLLTKFDPQKTPPFSLWRATPN